MAKNFKIPKIDELPDIFDLILAGQITGYSADYLRQQAIKGLFPAFQMFPNSSKCSWRVYKTDFVEWIDIKRNDSAWSKNAPHK